MQQTIANEPLLTFKEAMSYLRVSRSTLFRWVENKKIPAYRVGTHWRFYASELRACVESVDLKTTEQGEEA